jgi:hypothetical protein
MVMPYTNSNMIYWVTHLYFMLTTWFLCTLVNKSEVSNRIAKCSLLFLEYDFKIVYKLGRCIK